MSICCAGWISRVLLRMIALTILKLLLCSDLALSGISGYQRKVLPGNYRVSYLDNLSTDGPFKQEGFINCSCNGRPELLQIPMEYLDEFFLDLVHYKTRGVHFTDDISDRLRRCTNCIAEIWICKTHPDNVNVQDCVNKRYTFADSWENVDGEYSGTFFDIPRRSLSSPLKRSRRQAVGKCAFPLRIQTADVSCFRYPNNILKCHQKCAFGYTLEEGISREMKCNGEVGTWKPRGFEECMPFVDCTLALKSSGFLRCSTATSTAAPSCNITCFAYEDRPEVHRKLQCRVYGGWSTRLPYCVTRSKSIELAPPPRIKLHPLSYDPYFNKQKNLQRRHPVSYDSSFNQSGKIQTLTTLY